MSNAIDGVTGGLQTTLPVAMSIGAFTAIAWVNCIELNVRIFITFKRYTGLYFYSLVASSWGIFIYSLSFLLKYFWVWTNDYASVSVITVGWYCMVTGQALVLYSRLHLVVRDRTKIKWILYMIIVDIFLFHFPTTVLTFGSQSRYSSQFTFPYSVMEKIQMTGFAIQEFIISGVYLYETRRMLMPTSSFQKERSRRVIHHLMYVNILIILLDVALLCTEYANLYDIETTLKGAVYSFKLRLEFAVLNQLMSLTSKGNALDLNPFSQTGSRSDRSGLTGNMETSNNRTVDDNHINMEAIGSPGRSPGSYTVFAGTGKHAYFPDNSVMKTTEIAIHSQQVPSQPDVCPKKSIQDGVDDLEKANGQDHAESATSSEVEFASQGF